MKFKTIPKVLYVYICLSAVNFVYAGNCVVQGDKKIGDCSNVNISSSKSLVVKSTGNYSDVYSIVVVKQGGKAYLSGIADSIKVESGGELFLSGISGNIDVFGTAEVSGTAGWITTHPKSRVTISGIADGTSGSGSINKLKGSVVGGVYIK